MFSFFEKQCDKIATAVHPGCPIRPKHIATDPDLWLMSHNLTETFGGDYRISSRIRDLVLICKRWRSWQVTGPMIAGFNRGKREPELVDPDWLQEKGVLVRLCPDIFRVTQNLVATLYLLAPETKPSADAVTVIHLHYIQWKNIPPTSGRLPISRRVLCGREEILKTALDPSSILIVASFRPENLKIQHPLEDQRMCPECLKEALRLSREGKFEGYDCVYVYPNVETAPQARVA